jgi:hypothetical protein
MFNPTAGVDIITKGQAQLFFLRFFAYDGDIRDPPKAYTAAFQVVVDDYSQLVIPNSNNAFLNKGIGLLVPGAGGSIASSYRNMSLLYYKTDATTQRKTVLCSLPPRRMWASNNQNYVVPYRQALITVDRGTLFLTLRCRCRL